MTPSDDNLVCTSVRPIIIRPVLRAVLTLLTVVVVPRPAAAALVCAVNRSVVKGGDSVMVTAYSDSDRALQTGKFSGADGALSDQTMASTSRSFEVRWRLPRAIGTYEITGTATFVDGTSDTCQARVVVTAPDLGPGVESGHQLLPPSSKEAAGYGSYTYLLCPAPAAATVRTRCERAVAAIVDGLLDIAQYERAFSKVELNTVYAPVTSPATAPASAADVMSRYDFARARRWLNNVDSTLRDGPYLVTVAKPLSATKQPFILQDLSGVPPPLVADWIVAFLQQLAQQTLYGRSFDPSLALRMRTVLGVVALAVPDITSALRTVISIH